MEQLLSALRAELTALGNRADREGAKRFFKETIESYGVRAATVKLLARTYGRQLQGKTKEEVFTLCENLLASGMMEEGHIAAAWALKQKKYFTASDFDTFTRWIDSYITNWANCDGFCNHTVGTLLEQYPSLLPRLHEWAASPNRWLRRASAVSLVLPARKGLFREHIFSIAVQLITDNDDLVQKGYGWMLKELAKKDAESVYRFVLRHRRAMPRTALRYAIEQLPGEWKRAAMEKP